MCVRATISEWTPELMKSKVMAVLTAGRRGGAGGEGGGEKREVSVSLGFSNCSGRCFTLWRWQDLCQRRLVYLLCLLLSLFVQVNWKHPPVHAFLSCPRTGACVSAEGWRNAPWVDALPQEAAAICFKGNLVNNGGRVQGPVVACKKNWIGRGEAGGRFDPEILVSVMWQETK